jgi:teichuronic acid biosynthesis glycosyltransferase TuaG
MMNPGFLVSIVLPSYNSEKYIQPTLESIRAQDYEKWELCIVDDCSVDDSLQIIENYASIDERIHVSRNSSNMGAAATRNKAIRMCRGRFIAFIDSDDLWSPTKLSRQVTFMLASGAPVSFTSYRIISEDGGYLLKEVDVRVPPVIGYRDLLAKKVTFGCSTAMVDKDQVGEFFMPPLRTGQDYATWLSILKRGFRAHLLKEILTSYRIRSGSISRNKFNKAMRQWHIYRKVEQLSMLDSLRFFCLYAYRAIFRR